MKMNKMDIVLAGVGGQGTLVAGRLLASVASAMDLDVKISEVHGMAQRGGSVITYARMGSKVYSPIVEAGQADYLLAFEELEAMRWAELLGYTGVALINSQHILPIPVSMGMAEYPSNIPERLEQACGTNTRVVHRIDARTLAEEAGNIRSVNVIMLGAMASLTDIPENIWTQAIDEVFPERFRAVNQKAFRLGYGALTG